MYLLYMQHPVHCGIDLSPNLKQELNTSDEELNPIKAKSEELKYKWENVFEVKYWIAKAITIRSV